MLRKKENKKCTERRCSVTAQYAETESFEAVRCYWCERGNDVMVQPTPYKICSRGFHNRFVMWYFVCGANNDTCDGMAIFGPKFCKAVRCRLHRRTDDVISPAVLPDNDRESRVFRFLRCCNPLYLQFELRRYVKCTPYCVDGYLAFDKFILVLEIDQYAHDGYRNELERMMLIWISENKPVVFVRFNPDTEGLYTDTSRDPLAELLQCLNYIVDHMHNMMNHVDQQLTELGPKFNYTDFERDGGSAHLYRFHDTHRDHNRCAWNRCFVMYIGYDRDKCQRHFIVPALTGVDVYTAISMCSLQKLRLAFAKRHKVHDFVRVRRAKSKKIKVRFNEERLQKVTLKRNRTDSTHSSKKVKLDHTSS